MGSLVTAYVVVWLAFVAFVARMGMRQRRLQRTVGRLENHIQAIDEAKRWKENAA